MTNRTLTVLAVLLVVLGGALLLPRADAPASREAVLPGWENARPDSLRLEGDGQHVTFRRAEAGAWSRSGGGDEPGGSRRIEALANGLLDLERGVVVARKVPVTDLARYGLEDPRTSVASWSGPRGARLAFGDPSPLPGEVYACVRDGESERVDVFLLPRGLSTAVVELARDLAK